MKELLGGLYERFRAHHDMDRPLLEWIGAVGFFAFPAFYLLRRTSALGPLYDDWGLRLVAAGLCLLLALRRWWPVAARPLYIGYAYLTVFYCLSFLLSFTMLKNQGGTPSVVNMVMGAILIILLADWRNTVLMLVGGYALSLAAYALTTEHPRVPPEFVISAAGSVLVVAAGALSHWGQKRAELERMRLVYSALAGSIAHEMRNPLMQLRHVLDTLDAGLATGRGNAASSRELAQLVSQGQEAVSRGLQGIALTLQQLHPHPVDRSAFRHYSALRCVRRAVDDFAYEGELARSRVRVEADGDFAFRGDQTVLLMVLFNLLKNALYYLPTHPALSVVVKVDGQAGRIVVQDCGPGIEADRLPRLFDEFNSSGKGGGTGLGLAFCRRAMQAFGGQIACESQPGAYTRFTLTFPQPEARQHAEFESLPQWVRMALADKHILVVDDEPLTRRATAARLAALGCAVGEADGGAQALERLRESKPDLVLMDVNMPGTDGFELTRQIRHGAVPGCESVPIVAFTGLPSELVGTRAGLFGMNGFLCKGCETQELAWAVARALEAAAPEPDEPDALPLEGRTILLAEDNSFNRAIVKASLLQLGADVIEAEHGEGVLQLLRSGVRPAALLVDLEMPGLDGLGLTRAVRALPAPLDAVPVVALTGHSDPARRAAARDAGMDGFLVKPVGQTLLRDELLRVLDVPAPPEPGAILLDKRRIVELMRLGVLDELMPGCFTEMRRLIDELDRALAAEDRAAARHAMHTLVGLSGEAGALSLHLAVKGYYAAVIDDHWPREAGWVQHILRLAQATEDALWERYGLSLQGRPGVARVAPGKLTS